MASRRSSLFFWGLYCVLASMVFIVYISTSRAISGDPPIMPLDDAYIHFQYARQVANGQPYIYNPGDVATSGATSFLYPYILATGYILGFSDLNLGYWAMGIGAILLAGSTMLVHLITSHFTKIYWLPFWISLCFILSGSISWHYMSGMETGLVITMALFTLYALFLEKKSTFFIAATLLALTRPEGSIMALIAGGIYVLNQLYISQNKRQTLIEHIGWIGLLASAFLLQPITNWLITGSPASTGGQSKSILGTVPFFWSDVVSRVFDNFTRMWQELLTGTNGDYSPAFIPLLAIVGIVALIRSRQNRLIGIIIVLWFLAISGAVSTLDTAFWHFKRYQIPLIALLFPLAGIGLNQIAEYLSRSIQFSANNRQVRYAAYVLAGLVILLFVIPTWTEFQRLYRVNVNSVVTQPLAMASWLNENTPEDAVIAVHDVGMMRYVGEHYTVDMVGLTTPEAADYWRNGPGAVAEFLLSSDPRPDYIAAYTTARGLNYLVDTPLYGELLVDFPAEFAPEDNVALAAPYQGIFRIDWETIETLTQRTSVSEGVQQYINSEVVYDVINVANLESEQAHHYTWNDDSVPPGFATEVYKFNLRGCTQSDCASLDGGRLITGSEQFEIHINDSVCTSTNAVLVTRVHPASRGSFDVFLNDEFISQRWIPEIPGEWLDIPILLESVSCEDTSVIRIDPHDDTLYMPYLHRIYAATTTNTETQPLATYQDGCIQLIEYQQELNQNRLEVNLQWQNISTNNQYATGDYKFFVHIYDDINTEPIRQFDGYPITNSLPPGNWLPGVISDSIVVDLTDIPAGNYQVAIGFYDPVTFERLLPEAHSDSFTVEQNSQRLFTGEVEIPNHG